MDMLLIPINLMQINMRKIISVVLLFIVARGFAQKQKEEGVFKTEIPKQEFNIILGRPTSNAIDISIYAYQNMEVQVIYGFSPNNLTFVSQKKWIVTQKMEVFTLEHLEAGKRYYYQILYSKEGDAEKQKGELHFFQTQRLPNQKFVFAIQADSHLDENTDPATYFQSLKNMGSDSVDFLIDLGDTWMTDKYRNDFTLSVKQYEAQRYYFSAIANQASLFHVLGNHDGESKHKGKNGNGSNMQEWSYKTRMSYFINPKENAFYSGNSSSYYAWNWGNALFLVLDPFTYSSNGKDPWQRSLGKTQYDWLNNTLAKSKAKFKFVFIHNLVGGVDKKGIARGGVEAVPFWEWGGLDSSGVRTFEQNRAGWEMPIHSLFVKYNVNIVFHGHDHFFAKQEKDGIVYQLLPQPGAMHYGVNKSVGEYGYKEGVILNAPGYLRVTLESKRCHVAYVQSSINEKDNKKILYAYELQ